MKADARVRLLAVSIASAIMVMLAIVAARLSIARAAEGVDAPTNGCGVVSCTVYLPLVVDNFPPPPVFEVTQAVQQPGNSVPLIANRTTYVRQTITATIAHANVSAYLHGSRNGVPLPGSPVAALNNPRTLKSTANRATLNDTFNFQLPAAWLNGTIELRGYAANGMTFTLTTGSRAFSFVNANPLDVTLVPIAYACSSGGSGTVTPAAPYDYVDDYTYKLYPVPSISMVTHTAIGYTGPCSGSVPTPTGNDWISMLGAVTDVWQSDGSPNRYYYGLVRISCGGSCIAGVGWIGWPVAIGADGTSISLSVASITHAHEVGHNHGREHAPGCNADSPDPAFPYILNDRGRIGDIAHPNYGFDIVTQSIYTQTTYDIMGYCNPQWVSDYTYDAIRAFAQSGGMQSITQGNRALLVSGSIDRASGQATFNPVFVLDVPSRLPPAGDYTIELLDDQDRIIAAYPFTPMRAQADGWRTAPAVEIAAFHLALPYADGIASIRVRRGETILSTLSASAHAPMLDPGVSTLSADGRSLEVHWSGHDIDGDRLRYMVRASTDNGSTWHTIGVDLTTPSIDLSPIDFGGERVLLEVLASDGLHTTRLQIGSLGMPAKDE